MTLEDQNWSRSLLEASHTVTRPERVSRLEQRTSKHDFQPRKPNTSRTAPSSWIGNETRVSAPQNPLPIRSVAPAQTLQPVDAQVKPSRWCEYHKTFGHGTDDCRVLKQRREAKGKADDPQTRRPFADGCKAPPPAKKDWSQSPNRGGNRRPRIGSANDVILNVIHDGSSNGGDSNRGRKRYARGETVELVAIDSQEAADYSYVPLVFTKGDEAQVKYPHQNVLLITAKVKHVQIRKIFVDNGSSADILYYDSKAKLHDTEDSEDEQVSKTVRCVESPPMERAQPAEALEEITLVEGDIRSVVRSNHDDIKHRTTTD
ncbi:hypothetical protein Droror1_Dr00016612 [Drosera rotundifolia]